MAFITPGGVPRAEWVNNYNKFVTFLSWAAGAYSLHKLQCFYEREYSYNRVRTKGWMNKAFTNLLRTMYYRRLEMYALEGNVE